MRTRIRKEDDWYFPQYKGLFRWKYFYERPDFDYYFCEVVTFKSLEETMEWLDTKTKPYKKKVITIINYSPKGL